MTLLRFRLVRGMEKGFGGVIHNTFSSVTKSESREKFKNPVFQQYMEIDTDKLRLQIM